MLEKILATASGIDRILWGPLTMIFIAAVADIHVLRKRIPVIIQYFIS